MANETGGMALDALLKNDKGAFEVLARTAGEAIPPPGYMQRDEAFRYLAQVYELFQGAERAAVEMALCQWCIRHDVGGTQDYVGKPPIVVGTLSVQAVEIFGKIIPTDSQGRARQFAATLFEKMVPLLLEADPSLRAALTPRALENGLTRGQELQVVSFLRGGKPGTQASSGVRYRVKQRNVQAARGEVVAPVVRGLPPGEEVQSAGATYHGLY
jgi:hypothetical protein